MSPVVGVFAELSIVCKDDLIVYVGPGETATATLDAPIAFAEGGNFAYDFQPDPNTAISISGPPGFF